jgi:hypothetical protein
VDVGIDVGVDVGAKVRVYDGVLDGDRVLVAVLTILAVAVRVLLRVTVRVLVNVARTVTRAGVLVRVRVELRLRVGEDGLARLMLCAIGVSTSRTVCIAYEKSAPSTPIHNTKTALRTLIVRNRRIETSYICVFLGIKI